MRPSQLPNTESSPGETLPHPIPVYVHRTSSSHLVIEQEHANEILFALLTLGVTNITPVWFLSRLCVQWDWWLASGHWWLAEIFLPSGPGPWVSCCQEREWFYHFKGCDTDNIAVRIYSISCCVVPRNYPNNKLHLRKKATKSAWKSTAFYRIWWIQGVKSFMRGLWGVFPNYTLHIYSSS